MFVASLMVGVLACRPSGEASNASARRADATEDPAFAAVQERGAMAMGVDQYTSSHLFTPLADGGIIELQRDTADASGISQIRDHMQLIARAFGEGDFTLPGMVHAQVVPGTDSMRARRAAISYRAEPLPRGAQVRITTTDPVALRAVHAFLAFQRSDHHAGMKH